MAISLITPVSGSLIRYGDDVSFTIPNTYTSLVISVFEDAGTVVAYDSSVGTTGGYTTKFEVSGGNQIVTISRDAGWDKDPQVIRVVEDSAGPSVQTDITYDLTVTATFPEGRNPYNPIAVGDLIVTDTGVSVRTDVGWIDFVGFTVVDNGNGKITITDSGGGMTPTLDGVINYTTPDNDVTIPLAAPIIFRGGGAALTPLTVSKTEATSSTPALLVEAADNLSRAIVVKEIATNQQTIINYDGVTPTGQYSLTWGGGDIAGAAGLAPVYVFGNDDATGDGGIIYLKGGDATAGVDNGGDAYLVGGDTVGGAEGVVRIGAFTTSEVVLNATSNLKADKPLKIKEQAAADADTPTYGQYWVRSSDGAPMFTDDTGTDSVLNESGGAGGGTGQWDYVSGGGAPASTQFTANSDTLASVVTLNFSDSSGSDNNFSSAFANIQSGDYIVLRDNAGGGAHGTFLVSSSVDNTTYWTFTVSTGNVAGTFSATNTYDVWVISSGGSGDVTGGSASVVSEIPRYTSTTGKAIGRSDVLVGGTTPTAGTRTLGTGATFCGGHIVQTSGSATISTAGNGVIALGSVTTSNASAVGLISASGSGSFVCGRVSQSVAGTGTIQSNSVGSFVSGDSQFGGTLESVSVSNGSFVQGYSISGAVLRCTGAFGGFAQGSVSGAGSQIIASAAGALARGYVNVAGGKILASAIGSIAIGANQFLPQTIQASGSGAFAGGYALIGSITATQNGSFAWGYTGAAAIAATANNAVQFGEGTNNVANSLQVGNTTNGVRLQAAGTTSTTAGSLWCDGTNLLVRSGGANLSLSRPTITGSRSGGAALTNLLAALSTMNLIIDSTTA